MSFLDWYIPGLILFGYILVTAWTTVKDTKFVVTVDDVIMTLWLGLLGPLWAFVIAWGVYKRHNKWLCIRVLNFVKEIRKQKLYTNDPDNIPTLLVEEPTSEEEEFNDTELSATGSYRASQLNSIEKE